jgi:protein-S-isoprenylcysteine O-methyltransferase Ste14
MKLPGIAILVFFYAVYIGKMLLQKRKGIHTDQIAKGGKRDSVFYTELVLKVATYTVVATEVVSIFAVKPLLPQPFTICGLVLGCFGDVIFLIAVVTMKDSWRAGIAEDDKTEMVTSGIYRISRNPAFLGFDCVYIGLVLMFFNLPLLLFSIFAMLMLHLQILQEEKYLVKEFGEGYINYKKKVCRYIGRK